MKRYKRLKLERIHKGSVITVGYNTKLHLIFPKSDWDFLYSKHYRYPTKPLTIIQDMVFEIFPSFRTLECIYDSIHGVSPVFNEQSTLGDFIKVAFSKKQINIRRFGIDRRIYIRGRVITLLNNLKN